MADTEHTDWRDLMVAALYDELDPERRTELEDRLATDHELHQEWCELREARAQLARLGELEEEVVDEIGGPWFGQPPATDPWRHRLMSAAAGFALAASLFVALLLVGLRVDRTPAGWLVRLGVPEEESGASLASPPVGHEVVAAQTEPLTREEFTRFASMLVNATDARIDELERRQSMAQVQVAGELYDALALSQRRQYEDIRDRLDAAVVQAALSDATRHPTDRR